MIVSVKVKPRARVTSLTHLGGNEYMASLKAGPVDGKANEELVNLLSATFSLPKAQITIKTGSRSKIKLVELHGI